MAISPLGADSSSVLYSILKSIVLIVLGSLTLMVLSKKFKTKDTSFTTALKVNLVIVVLSFVWTLISQALQNPSQPSLVLGVLNFVVYYLVYIVLALYLIMKFYHVNMTEAVSMWVLFIITYIAINLIFSVIQISLQMRALSENFGQMQPTGAEGTSVGDIQQMPVQNMPMMPSTNENNEETETGSGTS